MAFIQGGAFLSIPIAMLVFGGVILLLYISCGAIFFMKKEFSNVLQICMPLTVIDPFATINSMHFYNRFIYKITVWYRTASYLFC